MYWLLILGGILMAVLSIAVMVLNREAPADATDEREAPQVLGKVAFGLGFGLVVAGIILFTSRYPVRAAPDPVEAHVGRSMNAP